jgi:hypothetical protein
MNVTKTVEDFSLPVGHDISTEVRNQETSLTSIRNLAPDHCRILYLISKYAEPANSFKGRESWIRQLALLVLIYEGIEVGSLKLDFAPNLVWISSKCRTERKWLRISQEAKSIIDDLWELKLINGIKLSCINYLPVTAYQISKQGRRLLCQIPESLKAETHKFIFPPVPQLQNAFQVRYDGDNFFLHSGAYVKRSKITDSEDVSYVSSPYLPACLRSNCSYLVEPTCNKLRATESAFGQDMMLKKSDENIVLSQAHALVGEWMPFGANQIAALSERLGAMERCQGGLFSSKIDENPSQTHFQVPPGLTQARILDFDSIEFINFEAEINFPEKDGIIQVENFGMHLNVSGTLLYGIKIEAIMNRAEKDIPFDLLARLLVDIHQDSSEIIRDLLSSYQLSIMDMIYMGKASHRNKYNLITAQGIEPKLPALKYLDKGDRENELKQVLGEIYACYDITKEDVLFLGRDGCLFCGPNAHNYDSLLTTFMGLNSRDIFIRNFYVRTFVLDDTLNILRKMIKEYRKDPNNTLLVEEGLSEAARHIIILIESLQYLLESVEDLELPLTPSDPAGIRLFRSLSLMERKNNILVRCKDSIKLIEKLRMQLDALQTKFEGISKVQLMQVSREFELNTKRLVEASILHCRMKRTLEIIRFFFAGSLAFDIIDRLGGGSFTLINAKWVVDWIQKPIIDAPILFLLLNLLWFQCIWAIIAWGINWKQEKQSCITLRAHVDKKINFSRLKTFLSKKKMDTSIMEYNKSNPTIKIFLWRELSFPWKNADTMIELRVDVEKSLLRSIRLQVKSGDGSTNDKDIDSVTSLCNSVHEHFHLLCEHDALEKFTTMLKEEGIYPLKSEPLTRLGTIRNLAQSAMPSGSKRRRKSSVVFSQMR